MYGTVQKSNIYCTLQTLVIYNFFLSVPVGNISFRFPSDFHSISINNPNSCFHEAPNVPKTYAQHCVCCFHCCRSLYPTLIYGLFPLHSCILEVNVTQNRSNISFSFWFQTIINQILKNIMDRWMYRNRSSRSLEIVTVCNGILYSWSVRNKYILELLTHVKHRAKQRGSTVK